MEKKKKKKKKKKKFLEFTTIQSARSYAFKEAQLAPNYFLTHVDTGAKRFVKLCCRDNAINCLLADSGHCGLGPINLQQKYQFSSATQI